MHLHKITDFCLGVPQKPGTLNWIGFLKPLCHKHNTACGKRYITIVIKFNIKVIVKMSLCSYYISF